MENVTSVYLDEKLDNSYNLSEIKQLLEIRNSHPTEDYDHSFDSNKKIEGKRAE